MIVAGIAITNSTPLPGPNTFSMFSRSANGPNTSFDPSLANSFSLVTATLAASNNPWPSCVWKTSSAMINCRPIPQPTTRHGMLLRWVDIAQAKPRKVRMPSRLMSRNVITRAGR